MDILTKQPSVQGRPSGSPASCTSTSSPRATESRGKVNAVHFTPGARTAWHRHLNGQTLHVTEGIGLTQSRAATSR